MRDNIFLVLYSPKHAEVFVSKCIGMTDGTVVLPAYQARRINVTRESWMPPAADDDGGADDWFGRMMKEPKFRADYERSMDECDAEDALGVRGYTTEEVFAKLKKEFPRAWGLSNVR